MSAPGPWDEVRIREYSTRGFLRDGSNYPGGALCALQIAIKEIDRIAELLSGLDTLGCAYCGMRTERMGHTPAEVDAIVSEHVLQCPKRPERRLAALLSVACEIIGIDMSKFKDADAIAEGVRKRLTAITALVSLRPLAEYQEKYGDVLWWHLPVCEYPIVGEGPGAGTKTSGGEPTDCQRLHDHGWLTHWSPLPRQDDLKSTDGARI